MKSYQNKQAYIAVIPFEQEEKEQYESTNVKTTTFGSSVHPTGTTNHSTLRIWKPMYLVAFIGMLMIISFIIDDDTWNSSDRGSEKDLIPPTLQPGGGRDWELNLQDGTIVAKHDENLVLGSFPKSPLILVNKGDSNQLTFSTDDIQALSQGESVDLTGLTFQFPDDDLNIWDVWYYKDAAASNKNESITVEYLDDNFIVWKDGDTGRDLVLDISFNVQAQGNTVNFVAANDEGTSTSWWKKWFQPKTFQYGGGRDWIINLDDGTISPKHTPYLVLGYGKIHLMLTEKDSSAVISFDNLEALANGSSVELKFKDGALGIGQIESEEKFIGPWRYIESYIVPSSDAVPVKYVDNNYIATAKQGVAEEKALVLDVSFWNMVSGNTVNFVGGWTWKESNDDDNKNVNI